MGARSALPSGPYTKPELCMLAGITHGQLTAWIKEDLLAGRGSAPLRQWTNADVLILAVLGQLARLRVELVHLKSVAGKLYCGASETAAIPPCSEGPIEVLYHASLFNADELGYFSDLAREPGAHPTLALFGSYADYCTYLEDAGQLPSSELLEAARTIDPIIEVPVLRYLELTQVSPEASASAEPLWQFSTFEDEMFIQPRNAPDDLARHFADDSPLSCFIVLSVPALHRDVLARARSLAQKSRP